MMKTRIFVIAGSLCCLLCPCAGHYDHKEAERYIVESEPQSAESVAIQAQSNGFWPMIS
jgi:hypothetical protein